MSLRADNNTEWHAVAAVALAAMCIVTFDHEALGHGGMCLAVGGHIEVLTSSIFHCNTRSVWIDPAGPMANGLAGGLALLMANRIAGRLMATRLLLTLVAALSFFWESGYLTKAMLGRKGDLYFAAKDFLGEPSLWWRIVGTGLGIILYAMTVRWVARSFTTLFPGGNLARRAARIAWTAATLGAAVAAIFGVAHGWAGIKDAVLEIGVASIPLLFVGGPSEVSAASESPMPIRHSGMVIGLSIGIFVIFALTLGRGLYF